MKAKVTLKETGDVVYEGEFDTQAEAQKMLTYMVPNCKAVESGEVDGYLITISGLPATEAKAKTTKPKPTETNKQQ